MTHFHNLIITQRHRFK